MSEPDEAMVEAVAFWLKSELGFNSEEAANIAEVALSVPVVRDALARDAQVREIAKTWTDRLNGNDPWPTTVTIEAMASIAALYPSPGDRDDSEEQR